LIEAGRISANYDPVDLSELTAELSSVFRSAIESAGLRLSVDCRPLKHQVYVDREMWEKIVTDALRPSELFAFRRKSFTT
jgi:hypothetical protein